MHVCIAPLPPTQKCVALCPNAPWWEATARRVSRHSLFCLYLCHCGRLHRSLTKPHFVFSPFCNYIIAQVCLFVKPFLKNFLKRQLRAGFEAVAPTAPQFQLPQLVTHARSSQLAAPHRYSAPAMGYPSIRRVS